MLSEQRLSVTFGAFSCDVVGYDDPFKILNRVVELFTEIANENPAFAAGSVGMSDMERAQVAAGLSGQASRIEEMADETATGGTRYVITKEDTAPLNDVDLEPAPIDAELEEVADAEEEIFEEEIVVAAVAADEPIGAGELELRDTVSGLDAEEIEPELETNFLSAVNEAPLDLDVPAEIAEPEVATAEESAEESVVSAPEAEIVSEVVEAETAEPIEPVEPLELATVAVEPEEELVPIVEEAAAAVAAPISEPRERRPLRLEVPSANLDKTQELETAVEEPSAQQKAEEEKPAVKKPRVTVTKLPLRSDSGRPKHEMPKRAQTLTPIQKAEPVVTLSSSIADSAVAAVESTRAERIRAKMERRNKEDEGDNFLFADVDEAVREANIDAEATRHDDVLSLGPSDAHISEEPETSDAEEGEKKPRRSLAGFLGFGKSAKTKDERVLAEPVLEAVEGAKTDTTSKADGFDRLRESVAAAMPAMGEPDLGYATPAQMPETISEAIDYDDETSPTAFARRVGANTLHDLLEASAVYMAVVEGKSKFSRRDVMQALNQIGADKDYTQEARLKSFRKLLTSGSLVRVDDGLFTVSQATRFGYETQLQA